MFAFYSISVLVRPEIYHKYFHLLALAQRGGIRSGVRIGLHISLPGHSHHNVTVFSLVILVRPVDNLLNLKQLLGLCC